MQNSQETYKSLAGLGVLYGCPRPLFSIYKVASLSVGFSILLENIPGFLVCSCLSRCDLSCVFHTLMLESEVLLLTERPHLGLSVLFDCLSLAE